MSEINTESFKRNFFKIAIVLGVFLSFIYILIPFLIPILLGGILAMAFSPSLSYFIQRGWSRQLALLVLTLLLLVIGVAPVALVLMKGARIVITFLSQKNLISKEQYIEAKIYTFLEKISHDMHFDPQMLRDKFDHLMSSFGNYGLNFFSSLLAKIPEILFLCFITVLSFYFSLLGENEIRLWFDRYFYFTKPHGDAFISLLKIISKQIFFSNVMTGIIQATILASGAFFCRTGDFFVVFIITFFLSFVPTGAAPVGFLLAFIAFFEQRIASGIVMAFVAAFSGIIDNIIRPYLNSRGEVRVPGFVNFLAIFGGVLSMGLAGLFVGPLIASLAFRALPIILDEWYPDTFK